MEVTLTPRQAATLADLIREHPDRPLTLRQLRDKATVLAELGAECALIAPDKEEGGDAA